MNVAHATLKVVVMILLVSNSLYSMDSVPRAESPLPCVIEADESSVEIDIAPVPFQQALPPSKKILAPKGDELTRYLRDYDVLKQGNGVSDKYPLHKAVREGKIEVVRYLCEKGANPLSYNHIGFQPLHCAIWLSDEELAVDIVDVLRTYFLEQKQISINFLNAIIKENLKKIIEYRESDAHEILRFFIPSFKSFFKIDSLQDYIALLPDYNDDEEDKFEYEKNKARELLAILKPMDIMAIPTRSSIMPLTLAIEAKKFILAKKIIEYGAPINSKSSSQRSLILAIKSHNIELIDLLLEKGARVTPEVIAYLKNPEDSSDETRKYIRGVTVIFRNAIATRNASTKQ